MGNILVEIVRRKTILRCLDLAVSPMVMAFLMQKTKLNPKTLNSNIAYMGVNLGSLGDSMSAQNFRSSKNSVIVPTTDGSTLG